MKKLQTIYQKARELRQDPTPTEQILWRRLRYQQLDNYRFRRQQPIGPYIVDFCCLAVRLIVELDGDSHIGKEAYDGQRQKFLATQGFKVLRFIDTEIYENLEDVIEFVWHHCHARDSQLVAKSPPPPTRQQPTAADDLPRKGGGGKTL